MVVNHDYLLYLCYHNYSNMATAIKKKATMFRLEETLAALKEAKSGKLRDVAPIDTSSVEAMVKSMDL